MSNALAPLDTGLNKCPKCNTSSVTQWLLMSSFQMCPNCKEDIEFLRNQPAVLGGVFDLKKNTKKTSKNYDFKEGDKVKVINVYSGPNGSKDLPVGTILGVFMFIDPIKGNNLSVTDTNGYPRTVNCPPFKQDDVFELVTAAAVKYNVGDKVVITKITSPYYGNSGKITYVSTFSPDHFDVMIDGLNLISPFSATDVT